MSMNDEPVEKRPRLDDTFTAVIGAIHLTETENQIFDTIQDTIQHFNLGTVVRVAGGWVRDKLLNKDTFDIDFALDNKMGVEFAEKVHEYMTKVKGFESGRVGVVPCNPEQSKHLETARLMMFGMWVDFVHLRAEEYTEDSRIPSKVRLGTPLEDALRRDLTINAMYYNLSTRGVEDLTGHGMSDLRNGICRTPLPALETFKDDPLRVLRAVRFAARLGYKVDDTLMHAAQDPSVHTALAEKISRERIGTEMDGIFASARPGLAIHLLKEMDVANIVFETPEGVDDVDIPRGLALLRHAHAYVTLQQQKGVEFDKSTVRQLYLSCVLHSITPHVYHPKGKAFPAIHYVVMHALKWRTVDFEHVNTLLTHCEKWKQFVMTTDVYRRREAGVLIKAVGDTWPACLVLAAALVLLDAHPSPPDVDLIPTLSDSELEIVERFEKCRAWIYQQELQTVWKEKPLLNGQEVIQALDLPKGPLIGKAMEAVMLWQLDNPAGSKDDCKAYLKATYPRGLGL